MTRGSGEMSFLDHLEELRWRLIWSLAALIVGFALGMFAVNQFQLVEVLAAPAAPYLPDGKLTALRPTDGFMITLKLGLSVGLVLASPVIIWQIWAFVAPALYTREKKALVPALFAGLILFAVGATLAFQFVIPTALRFLFGIQRGAINYLPTADGYFGFVLQIVLALGISFELPLVLVLLASLGVIGPSHLRRFRRHAIVAAFIAGSLLSPGADVLSMAMLTGPLILLYEIGVIGSVIVDRRRRRHAAITSALVAFLSLAGAPAEAQDPVRQAPIRADTMRTDTARAGQALDSARARRMGLPTAPSRSFADPDSTVRALLDRKGYRSIRYRADTAVVYVPEERLHLLGGALTEREGSVLEADTIRYRRPDCVLDAAGSPHLFDRGQVLVGQGIRYNSCTQRGVVNAALTNFTEGATVWFLRGNIAQDSSSKRIYSASSEITSCDLPVAHYHFSAGQVKWISKNVLVARPVVLYVSDVPILWLPFIFQDIRSGRRSGILFPQFGINDLVRPNRSYERQVTNLGYYWAINDYLDVAARFDWYANRYIQYGITGQYNWLDRFLNGGFTWSNQREEAGGSSVGIRWNHSQRFNLSTDVNLNFNYVSDTRVLQNNAINPLLNTQQIQSRLNFTKRLGWGTLNLGASRTQSLTNETVQQELPSVTLSPVPIDVGENVTWSPSLRFTNNTFSNQSGPPLVRILPGGVLDTVPQTVHTRATAFSLNTPLRIGSFNWQNRVQLTDELLEGRDSVEFKTEDTTTVDPTDSVTVSRVYTSRFQTGFDWDTDINLPILFRGSWKLQPSVGIDNATSAAPFAVRNRNTNGDIVMQGKRFSFGLSSAPTFFAFFPGLGPATRIRHSVSPSFSYRYAPAAGLSEEFARAIAPPGQTIALRSDPTQALTVSLSQVFEAKLRTTRPARPSGGPSLNNILQQQVPPATDTLEAEANVRKIRLLSISTSGVTYDIERAKLPGQSGWVTQTLNNSFLSDLLPGFSLTLTHDLWRGRAGSDTADFDPFLQSVSANFGLSSRTLCAVGGLLGLCRGGAGGRPDATGGFTDPRSRGPSAFSDFGQTPLGQGRPFSANVSYSLSRQRAPLSSPAQQNIHFNTSFSPTPFWALSWSTQYDITNSEFASQDIRLERDLHEWRAAFSVVRNPNGNFSLYFSVHLTDLPDLKFDYDQTTFAPPQ